MGDARAAIEALITLMARLRDPQRGCPWDLEQTFASIAPFTVEEAYEVADAIERGEHARLRDELGDLLFQVVFHARMAEERGWFDFAQVAESIHAKLVRRHPHVFAGAAIEAQHLPREWEAQKAREREQAAGELGDRSALAGVPKALPALMRAAKLGRRAARVGFDWPDARGSHAKVVEELGELDRAMAGTDPQAVEEELGDLLFAIVNLSRHLKIDAEGALRRASDKFTRRFAHVETRVHDEHGGWGDAGQGEEHIPLAVLDRYWDEAKQSEGGS